MKQRSYLFEMLWIALKCFFFYLKEKGFWSVKNDFLYILLSINEICRWFVSMIVLKKISSVNDSYFLLIFMYFMFHTRFRMKVVMSFEWIFSIESHFNLLTFVFSNIWPLLWFTLCWQNIAYEACWENFTCF